MRAAKWGNSLAFRLPKHVIEAAQIDPKDDYEAVAIAPGIVELRRRLTREEALAQIRSLAKTLPPGWKFDREEANAR